MTTFTDTWDASFEASPADSDEAAEGADRIRELKVAISERLEVDHSWAGDANDGVHSKVTLTERSDPSIVTNSGVLYSKDVAGRTQLFYIDSLGAVTQLTKAPGFRTTLASDQAVSSSAITKVLFTTEAFDNGGMFSSNRFTPDLSGKYYIGCVVRLSGIASGETVTLYTYKSGSIYTRISAVTTASDIFSLNLSDIVSLDNGTDYVEIYITSTDASYSVLALGSSFFGFLVSA